MVAGGAVTRSQPGVRLLNSLRDAWGGEQMELIEYSMRFHTSFQWVHCTHLNPHSFRGWDRICLFLLLVLV